ncbi:MAG: GNAT family N-acetyltransferase [Ignavibacteria bacterium]
MNLKGDKKYKTKKDIDVVIRNAKAQDILKIIEIKKSVVKEGLYMLRGIGETNYTFEGEKKDIENHLTNKGSLYIVAEAENAVVGFLEFENGGFSKTAHSGMLSMFILKKWRECGIGKMLMENMILWAEKNPLIEKLTLAVFSSNIRAQNLYKKFGFAEEGRCPKDMKLKDGTYIDSVLMYKFVK